MQIQVLIDIHKPLRQSKRIKKPEGDAREVKFKYERLAPYYYLFGLLGHVDDFFPKMLTMQFDNGLHGWGPNL